jgi:Uma2 family endonuclease
MATIEIDEDFYPSSDGEPMAETPIHVNSIILLKEALDDFFELRQDVYIGTDMFWYWEEGNPKARKAPDIMVIFGVGRAERRSFFTWLENGAVPKVIFEIASKKTWRENLGEKQRLYERLGVKEYFIFDPEAKYLNPPLRGFRLSRRTYRELRRGRDQSLVSLALGLRLVPEGRMLRLVDKATGKPILTRVERIEQRNAEIARLNALLDAVSKKVNGSRKK